jgi:hypothetical protein
MECLMPDRSDLGGDLEHIGDALAEYDAVRALAIIRDLLRCCAASATCLCGTHSFCTGKISAFDAACIAHI